MNYYEKHFDSLSQSISRDEALQEIVKLFLFRNTKFSMPEGLNRADLFFQSSFIRLLRKKDIQSEEYQLALSQYFRFGTVSEDLLGFFLRLDEENTIWAIRLSGIIDNLNHCSWEVIQKNIANFKKLNDFYEVVIYLNEKVDFLKDNHQKIKKKWRWTHVDAIVFASLYLYEVVLTQYFQSEIKIPYQIDTNTPIKAEYLFEALHLIITHAYRSKKLLTDKNLRPTLDNRLEPYIYGKGLTEYKLKEYSEFKQFVSLQVELILFDDFVFNVFSYQKDVQYSINDDELLHARSKQGYDFYTEKMEVLWLYWKWRGLKQIDSPILDKKKLEQWCKSNKPEQVMTAFSDTQSAILLLKEIYGIEKIILNDNQEYDTFDTLFAINMQQQYYKKSFIEPFLDLYQLQNSHPLKILGAMTISNYLTGQNFYPIVTGKKEIKARSMAKAWILEGSNNARTKKMMAILEFWSCDLNDNNQDRYVEKPFYLLDGRVIQLPHRVGEQNIYAGIVNYLRRLHKNRKNLKNETSAMEVRLADLFSRNDVEVFCQHMPTDIAVGEIDLIVASENAVLVIELKSTYIKSNLKEAYHYQNFVLKKACYQLDRKLAYVKANHSEFINKPLSDIKFHSWIVDTTLEADHEKFNNHLKISLEELVICLNNHQDFLSFYQNPQEFGLNENNNKPFDLSVLVEQIESNNFWKECLKELKTLDLSS